MSKTLKDSWAQLAVFIIHKNSLDVGALNRIFLQATQTPQEQSAFTNQIEAFLQAISSEAKSKSQLHAQALALMAVEALLYNMYNCVRGNQGFKPASSSFYGFMSMSHLSADYSDTSHLNEAEPKRIIALIEHLANSDPFFRRVKIILDRNNNKERNHRYGENLIETINHILTKQKSNRQNFNKLRSRYTIFSAPSKNKVVVDFKRVNGVIFSNELNKIARLLKQGSDQVHLSLMRIYWEGKDGKERKQLEGSVHSGEQMIYNLHHYYVGSFQDENDLFEESKHPLFRLIKNQLLLFFTPFLHQFHAIVARLAVKGDVENAWNFYKGNESSLREDLLALVGSIPLDLVKLLHSLFRMVEQIYRMGKEGAVSIVKKLLFYSFLCSQTVIEDLLPHIDPSKYSHIYNHTISLFFQTSLRKFHELPPQKLSLLTSLTHEISSALDAKIGNGPSHLLEEESYELCFSIKDPILNYDYEIVQLALERIEFTPKDSKKFTMLKEAQKTLDSPIYKHFRKDASLNIQSEHGETDLATWMSVGGSREWGGKGEGKRERVSVRQSLRGLQTLRGEKVKELDRLRSEFEYYL